MKKLAFRERFRYNKGAEVSTCTERMPDTCVFVLTSCKFFMSCWDIKRRPALAAFLCLSDAILIPTLLRRFLLPVLILPTARLPSVYFRSRRKQIRTVGSGTVCQAVHTLLPHGFLRSLFPYLPEPVIWL